MRRDLAFDAFLALALASVLPAGLGCSTDDGKPSGASSSGSTGSSSGSSGGTADAGGTGDAGGNDAGGKKKNAEVGCTGNEECESNSCFVGGNQSYCAVPCTAANVATVCAAPFTGSCNNKGFCKRD